MSLTETKGSLPHSQIPAFGSHPVSEESSPHYHTLQDPL